MDIHSNPEYRALAKRRDDLMYVLITYGRQLGKALSAVQKEFRALERQCLRLEKNLEKEGYVAYC